MSNNLLLHDHITSAPTRNINYVILLFSLTNELTISINGESKDLQNHIAIINQGDLYQIEMAKNLIELKIPVAYFYLEDNTFFNCYFDRHLLQSNRFIKSIILQSITHFSNNEPQDEEAISKIIQTLYKEAVVRNETSYIPKMSVDHQILSNILLFINKNITNTISLLDLAQYAVISESYCSNLFVRYLNMNFKDFYTSLKIIHALNLLISTNQSITTISELSGFSSHTNFTNQFKKYLGFNPKQFRSKLNDLSPMPKIKFRHHIEEKHLDLISEFEFTDHLTTETTYIDIQSIETQKQTKSSKAFIHFQNTNELFQFVFNDFYNIELTYLPKPAILINDISDILGQQINFNLLNRCFEKLFEKKISLAVTIKNKNEFKEIYRLIISFLQSNQDYKWNKKIVKFMLVFDTETMSIQDIHLAHLKLKNKNRSIKFGLIVDGLLHQCETLQETYDIMNRMNFDYYFVDIENINTKNVLIDKQRGFTHASTHFENYIHFIEASNIPSTKFVYSSLSLRCFKYTNNGAHPLQLSDLVCHLTALLKYGGGICYELIENDPMYISLFNHHGSILPIMHLYQFINAFVDEPITIANNYLMSRKDGNYHFILFNKINDRYLSDSKQHYHFQNELSENSLFIVNTLNNEHGSIQHLMPQDKLPVYIEESIMKQLDRSNHPKTELFIQEKNHATFQITLQHDEVKYICIKPV
ncbi:AraC family transcriptional regulator Rsp [Staphylococcus sp. Marseille-Q1834]|uniref:AraC family transcriptional regulator Rsp n=1 Tax=Staphylococcus sp. Marseille-Q1834 TaxID=2866594 RepID=UPI0012B7DDCB|nr:AraC family transcriptional regulator Rsp [Staphylococcus sp. Marseille-Q1834]